MFVGQYLHPSVQKFMFSAKFCCFATEVNIEQRCRDASASETEDNQSERRNWQEDPEVGRKNRTWWGWGILHFSPTACETIFCWWQTWFQTDRPKSHQGYKNSRRICQFSIFATPTPMQTFLNLDGRADYHTFSSNNIMSTNKINLLLNVNPF